MKTFLKVFLASSTIILTLAFPLTGFDSVDNRTRRDVHCIYGQEYPHGSICCALCPAGTRVTSHCTKSGAMGKCEPCDSGTTYTEHANGLGHCFPCTQCRSDQDIVSLCTTTQDAECQCKSGRFCSPDQACEVCKKCTRCGKDEEVLRNCTATTDAECKKITPKFGSDSGSVQTAAIVTSVLFVTGIFFVIAGVLWWRYWKNRQEATDSEGSPSDEVKIEQHHTDNSSNEERQKAETRKANPSNWQLVRAKSPAGTEEERRVLCESLSSSASNSQHSLTGVPCSAYNPLQNSPAVPKPLPDRRKDEEFPILEPVEGEESLRKCFEYFEEVEFDYHKRFFRNLGIKDNVIKSKEHLPYEDKIHELLNIWMEKKGRDASLNHLLEALLALNQRRTAEIIMEKALEDGLYVRQC